MAQNVAESGVLGKALHRGGHKSCLVLSQEETSPPPEDKSSRGARSGKNPGPEVKALEAKAGQRTALL